MMAALRVVRAGIHATVQDAGRSGYRSLGVPGSGALDATALHLANALVGNAANTAALEMLYAGITVELLSGSARVAIACAQATIERPGADGVPLPAWHSAVLGAGDRLRVASPADTAAAYLAVEGSYATAPVLGSASTYVQGQLGGFCGRALQAGDVLPLVQAEALPRAERRYAIAPKLEQPEALRIMAGPQADRYADDALEQISSQLYRVTPASNRNGLRLEGALLRHRAGHDLLSEGVATGSIQVPGTGQPVLLLADHPTVGGYPKIATVISADLPAAGRLRIGRAVGFAVVDDAGAAAARHAAQAWIAERIAAIESVQS